MTQRNMTIEEYVSHFTKLYRYAPTMVATKLDKTEKNKFGLHGDICRILAPHRMKNFRKMVDCAKVVKREILAEERYRKKKRK